MSEILPLCASMAPLSAQQRHNAAISICQIAGYDRILAVKYLLLLGLIQSAPEGYVPTLQPDGTPWYQAASRSNA